MKDSIMYSQFIRQSRNKVARLRRTLEKSADFVASEQLKKELTWYVWCLKQRRNIKAELKQENTI